MNRGWKTKVIGLVLPLMLLTQGAALADAWGRSSGTNNTPWDCTPSTHRAHNSNRWPGLGYINAKSSLKCRFSIPSDHKITVKQRLLRSSWRGWVEVATSTVTCNPSSTVSEWTNHGLESWSHATCYNGSMGPGTRVMNAYMSWYCPKGSWHNYLTQTTYRIDVPNAGYYYAASFYRAGDGGSDDGKVYCAGGQLHETLVPEIDLPAVDGAPSLRELESPASPGDIPDLGVSWGFELAP